MSIEIRVRERARRDIQEAARWYESQRPGLGVEFLKEVKTVFARIADNPRLHPRVYRETHRALLGRFPFGVFYTLWHGKAIVIAVLHSSRNPRRWMERT